MSKYFVLGLNGLAYSASTLSSEGVIAYSVERSDDKVDLSLLQSGDRILVSRLGTGNKVSAVWTVKSVELNKTLLFEKTLEVAHGPSLENTLCQRASEQILVEIPENEFQKIFNQMIEVLSEDDAMSRKKSFEQYLKVNTKWSVETIRKNVDTYPPHFNKYVQELLHLNKMYDIVNAEDCDTIRKAAEKDNDKEGAGASWPSYYGCLAHYQNMLEQGFSLSDEPVDVDVDPQKVLDDFKKRSKPYSQKIRFGTPGTGKSFGIKEDANTERVVFHPDYDYAQFVGCYKPGKSASDRIDYAYRPQIFTKMYIDAWNNPTQDYCLVIEEINRGNCAQIFGDLFQLLDRDEIGFSRYPVAVDLDLWDHLVGNEGVYSYYTDVLNCYYREYDEKFDGAGKMAIPPNLSIVATMNTSDQSLFPMDSAFKRRFDWEYVPIDYKHEKANFFIEIGAEEYSWLSFLKKVNADIYKITESEDKQMGEFFVKPTITKKNEKGEERKIVDLKMFRSKVLFYLWDSVYKDESHNPEAHNLFHYDYLKNQKSKLTFQNLFGDDVKLVEIIHQMMVNLDKAYDSGNDKEFSGFRIVSERNESESPDKPELNMETSSEG